MTENLCNISIA